jgi:putative endopeptidase
MWLPLNQVRSEPSSGLEWSEMSSDREVAEPVRLVAHGRAAARLFLLTAFIALSFSVHRAGAADDPAAAMPRPFGTWGYDLTARDPAVKPGTDFFLHANGSWLKRTEIPADRVTFGVNEQLSDLTEAIVRKLIEDAAAGRSDDPDASKIGAAYQSFMDEARVEQLDAKPLAAGLAAIHAQKDKTDIAALMGTAQQGGQSSIFGLGISPDDKAPNRYAVSIGNGGMGLPDRDYYLTDQLADRKAKYQSYVALMLGMIGWDAPETNAKAIVEFETKLAQASWTRAESRDPEKIYNPMSVAELVAYAPGFDFRIFLRSARLGATDRLIVTTNTAFPNVAGIFNATPLETLKAWQAFHLTSGAAPYLSKRFVDARFDFYGKTLSGQPENQPRWKRAVGFVNGAVGESVGRMYVAKHFPPEAKVKMDALVKEVIAAMHRRIDRLDWMSPATKAKAQEKLSRMTVKIGYPVKWRNYGPLTMSATDLYGNVERTLAYDWNYVVSRLDQPVDKDEWDMTPQTVNDYYNPLNNEIVFPAAQLQPPFFDPTADLAVNYGGIGATIGHEMTHGFDDTGRKYDGNGVLTDWWTAEDAAKFQSQADKLAAQFDKFEPVKGYFVNGQLTAGENIADLGGLLLALDAYHAALGGKEAPVLDGLTGDQRFFLAYAQSWRSKSRDEATIQQVKSNEHAPDHFRVNGPLRNTAAWYDAFKITPADPMYLAPDNRVNIW